MLNPQRERIQDDLRGLLAGEVHCDTVMTQLYATDASIFEVQPLGVVFPQTTMDVVTTVQYARKHGIPIHPRGAGSYCAGGVLGDGLILDFSRFMRRILSLDKDIVKVQAGVQVSRLNEFLRPHGLCFRPDPGNARATTIGGMMAVDGYGSHWISYGRPSDWLQGLETVMADGTILSWSRAEGVADMTAAGDSTRTKSGRLRGHSSRRDWAKYDAAGMEKRRILGELKNLLTAEEEFLQRTKNPSVIDRMGYRTNILRDEKMDLAGLIASSEGTLGVITTVTLRLQKRPENRMTVLLLFERMENATRAVQFLAEFPPDACDLMDRRHIHFASERDVRFEVLFPAKTEAALLMEFHHQSRYALYDQLRKLEDVLVHQRDLAFQMVPAWDDQEAELFWSLADTLQPLPHWVPGVKSPVTVVEDVAVPPAKLHEFILKTQDLLRSSNMTGSFYAHAAQGQVRLHPLVDTASAAMRHQLLDFARLYYQLVADMGGTLGAAFGIGLARAAVLPHWMGEKYEISCKIKDIFDPQGMLQPGKLGSRAMKMTGQAEEGFIRGDFLRYGLKHGDSAGEKSGVGKSEKEKPGRERARPGKEGGGAETFSEKSAKKTDAPELAEMENTHHVLDFLPPDSESLSASESTIFAMKKVMKIVGESPEEYGVSQGDAAGAEKSAPGGTGKNDARLQPLTEMGLEWSAAQLEQVSHKCNGCGDCRAVQQVRMCPMFHANLSESASPRAKVNLMEGILSGRLALAELGGDTFHQVTRQCFQCHSCRRECPAHVDVSQLVRRAEEAWARARGLNFYESLVVRMDRWAKKLHYAAPLVNLALASPWGRWFIEKMFGIARGRKLPRFERRTFLEMIRQENRLLVRENTGNAGEAFLPGDSLTAGDALTSGDYFSQDAMLAESAGQGADIRGNAVYFVDTYANFFDVPLASATRRVFAHHAIPLAVPEYQKGSGLAAVVLGRSDYVQRRILRNAAILADYTRQGYDVICTEPATVLAMKWEFPQIFPESEDVQIVSRHIYDACDYLWRFHQQRKLRLPKQAFPAVLGYHAPCRLQALNVGTPDAYLMGLIPGLEIRHSATGCCGMGGAFGMLACNFALSQRMGRKMHTWLRDRELRAGITSCSACKMQMEHGSSKHTVHPMKILAMVYGLMPELEAAMKKSAPDLVLT